MKRVLRSPLLLVLLLILLAGAMPVHAGILIQCPTDLNADGVSDDPNVICMHLSGGDGFSVMADGYDQYHFSFGLVPPGTPENQVIANNTLKARIPAPMITMNEGQELYLSMSNVGMMMRPDLFDPHSVHWHGYPNAAPIFDGLPEPSPTAVMGSTFTYYYKAHTPGTYFYHCHVEAAEHMQMGMIGNLYVRAGQDGTPIGGFTQFAYNDGDGSTGYDVDYPIQLTGFDSRFHDAHIAVQPLPFAAMQDNYAMINGRGYPDTINPNPTPANLINQEGFNSQRENALITAASGQTILVRLSNVSTTDLWTIATTMGVPLKVVGRGAEILRGPTGIDTSYQVSVLNTGGGQAYDVLIDTTGVPAGTYFLYTTNLAHLSNNHEKRGGLMTEIVITP